MICNPFIYSCSTIGDSSVMRLAGAQLKQLETSPPALGAGGGGGCLGVLPVKPDLIGLLSVLTEVRKSCFFLPWAGLPASRGG